MHHREQRSELDPETSDQEVVKSMMILSWQDFIPAHYLNFLKLYEFTLLSFESYLRLFEGIHELEKVARL